MISHCTPSSVEKAATLFWTITRVFVVDFDASGTEGNRNVCSTIYLLGGA